MNRGIFVFFGLVASGKSFLAGKFASTHQLEYFNTDRIRKELAGMEPVSNCSNSLNQGIYTREFTLKTYGAVLERARIGLLDTGVGVVLDGSYSTRLERARVLGLAAELKTKVMFVFCNCSEEVVRERLGIRSRDEQAVSDGNWEVYQLQKKTFEPPVELGEQQFFQLDTDQDIEKLLEILEQESTQRNMLSQ